MKIMEILKKIITFLKGDKLVDTINFENNKVVDQSTKTNIQINGPSINNFNISSHNDDIKHKKNLKLAIKNQEDARRILFIIYFVMLILFTSFLLSSYLDVRQFFFNVMRVPIYILIGIDLINFVLIRIFNLKEYKIGVIVTLVLDIMLLIIYTLCIGSIIDLLDNVNLYYLVIAILVVFLKELALIDILTCKYFKLVQNTDYLMGKFKLIAEKYFFILIPCLPIFLLFYHFF